MMHSFEELSALFRTRFESNHFPEQPASLYDPNRYFLGIGGKRVRPVMCLMGNELFGEIEDDAYQVAIAMELFHNFTLIHDDIMDKAPLRRGQQTVHEKWDGPTALLAGDVMLVKAYDYLSRIKSTYIHPVLQLFNKTATEVCEGQQLDMDFEKIEEVTMDQYLHMIELKTSVALGGCLQLGSIIGGAGGNNQKHLYEFGRNLGIAFQVQDDYLDAFGNPGKVGKQIGGDILANKKTFLMIRAMEIANEVAKKELRSLMHSNRPDKVASVLDIFRNAGVDSWAMELKHQYTDVAFRHLEEIAVMRTRKEPLRKLAYDLLQRES